MAEQAKELTTMDPNSMTARPKRREEGLIVRDVGDEVVVYDLDRHKAHCLNTEAAEIWRACDGDRDVRALVDELYGATEEEQHIAACLVGIRELKRKHLLDEAEVDAGVEVLAQTSRREILARFGKAAAVTIALPAVMSIVSPTPAEADSCLASGAPCSSSAQCCSGLCNVTCA